jgi:hypothetical protein
MYINNNSELIFIGGTFYPVAKRRKGNSKIDICPYCEKPHEHDTRLAGHNMPPCSKIYYDLKFEINGQVIPIYRGYIIKEY